jgi:hypothetical protein
MGRFFFERRKWFLDVGHWSLVIDSGKGIII